MHEPKVLFLDEPTIGLDVMVKERIRKAIKQMNEKYGTTIVLTTHDMNDIEELCHRIIIIDKGQVLYDGGIDTIRRDFGSERKIIFDLRFDDSGVVLSQLEHLFDNLTGCTPETLFYHLEGSQLTVTFDRNIINISDIMSLVLQNFKVIDFSVQDMDIEAIVKKF